MKKILITLLIMIVISSCAKPDYINVMSFNIRLDHAGDGDNNWQYRKDEAAEVVLLNNIDILGGQEVLGNQLTDLLERLPDYGTVGVGRDDGANKGEYSPLIYKKNKFDVEKSGTFWISETPDKAGSMGWDAACPRVASWAIFKDKNSGKRLFAINTHLDHMGLVARSEGANLLVAKIKELSEGLPVVLTGDFNDISSSDVVKNLTNQEFLHDSRSVAEKVVGTDWTFHDFGRLAMDKRERIDYIFVNNKFTVLDYEVLPDTLKGRYVSDHKPIFVKIKMN